MTRMVRLACWSMLTLPVVWGGYGVVTHINLNPRHQVGEQIDELNGVAIYFNGGVNTSRGRNLSADGYNIGIRYQCVEFVKRYYFERHGHRMPNAYGHARDFFDPALGDGAWNARRGMLQYSNGSGTKPRPDDLLVFAPSLLNRYGHVAVIAAAGAASVEVAQQNPGPFGHSREAFSVAYREGKWFIEGSRILGWLRLSNTPRDAPVASPPTN